MTGYLNVDHLATAATRVLLETAHEPTYHGLHRTLNSRSRYFQLCRRTFAVVVVGLLLADAREWAAANRAKLVTTV